MKEMTVVIIRVRIRMKARALKAGIRQNFRKKLENQKRINLTRSEPDKITFIIIFFHFF